MGNLESSLRVPQDHFGGPLKINLEVLCGHIGGYYECHFGSTLGSFLEYYLISLRVLWDHSRVTSGSLGATKGSLWGYFWVTLWVLYGHFECNLGRIFKIIWSLFGSTRTKLSFGAVSCCHLIY